MKIVLCSLTGFGNPLLRELCEQGRAPVMLYCREESGPFPYYPEEDLSLVARRLGIPFSYDAPDEEFLKALAPDLLLVASYHRVLPPAALRSAACAVNLHPSLLPRYRGRSPCYWVVRNGEDRTGVTAHLLTSEIDGGDIVAQETLSLFGGETQGGLRRRLSPLMTTVAMTVVRRLEKGSLDAIPQPGGHGDTYFPPFDPAKHALDCTEGLQQWTRHLRALTPWPGGSIEGARISGIEEILPPGEVGAPLGVVAREGSLWRVRIADALLSLRVATPAVEESPVKSPVTHGTMGRLL